MRLTQWAILTAPGSGVSVLRTIKHPGFADVKSQIIQELASLYLWYLWLFINFFWSNSPLNENRHTKTTVFLIIEATPSWIAIRISSFICASKSDHCSTMKMVRSVVWDLSSCQLGYWVNSASSIKNKEVEIYFLNRTKEARVLWGVVHA